ncbi:hypothetical protein BIV25_03020 [Streptomyces sp. MUSC 14]|uniref:hypothetical protein n=1 Tax=Streptomyces sp. MUSC 14 TaxID=1354889 RepID=UPI0008F5DC1C|nr:hypothetical protein [Streptomyces sp. MUSC 14]OIK02568.1 hypothetical protein BIV25_03020 [Streptomyces sp. MUSC 14]
MRTVWKLHNSVAQRFPLVARPRPACLPLPQRVQALAELADTAQKQNNPSVASTVFNQAALIASDIGLPDLARTMCTQHAAAYLCATPLSPKAAVRALEPAVNLVRLQLRAGHPDTGRQLLLTLFHGITHDKPTQVESIAIPANLVATEADRKKVRTWLWAVLLADGTRALTSAGHWNDALNHIQHHRGLAQRMLDGRQVAVLAALATGDATHADHLLMGTKPGEPEEAMVAGCLTVLCHRVAGRPWQHSLQDLVTTYLDYPALEGLAAFRARLGLVVLDLIDSPEDPAAQHVVADLHRRALESNDGYAARDALSHSLSKELATDAEAKGCLRLLSACALQSGVLPPEVRAQIDGALRTSRLVIRESLASPSSTSLACPERHPETDQDARTPP